MVWRGRWGRLRTRRSYFRLLVGNQRGEQTGRDPVEPLQHRPRRAIDPQRYHLTQLLANLPDTPPMSGPED